MLYKLLCFPRRFSRSHESGLSHSVSNLRLSNSGPGLKEFILKIKGGLFTMKIKGQVRGYFFVNIDLQEDITSLFLLNYWRMFTEKTRASLFLSDSIVQCLYFVFNGHFCFGMTSEHFDIFSFMFCWMT